MKILLSIYLNTVTELERNLNKMIVKCKTDWCDDTVTELERNLNKMIVKCKTDWCDDTIKINFNILMLFYLYQNI